MIRLISLLDAPWLLQVFGDTANFFIGRSISHVGSQEPFGKQLAVVSNFEAFCALCYLVDEIHYTFDVLSIKALLLILASCLHRPSHKLESTWKVSSLTKIPHPFAPTSCIRSLLSDNRKVKACWISSKFLIMSGCLTECLMRDKSQIAAGERVSTLSENR